VFCVLIVAASQDLYDRLVPESKGERKFTPIMIKRLEKLGIKEVRTHAPNTRTLGINILSLQRNPSKLSAEEKKAFARLDIDPATITWFDPLSRPLLLPLHS
jgi:methylenetetrahydrofolate dehydrogenase (NADP+)/methenyltetrahydrofolate cyclohydrolase/formyltetrahydrofolate synthetase